MKVNVYPFPSGLIFGTHIPAMCKYAGIFKERFCILLSECLKMNVTFLFWVIILLVLLCFALKEEKILEI